MGRGVPEQVFFDPVVDDWNDEAREREERAKAEADLLVFYAGDPRESGLPLSAFTLVEATLAVCRDPHRTLVVFDLDAVQGHARKVYAQTLELLCALESDAVILEDLRQAEDEVAKRFTSRAAEPSAG